MRHADKNPNVITLSGFGSGGVEELKESLEDDNVMYGLGRIWEFDIYTVSIDVLIIWSCQERMACIFQWYKPHGN